VQRHLKLADLNQQHRHSQGMYWVHVHPQGGEKNWA